MRPFGDRRSARRCGMKKNGYNADTANVLCSSAPNFSLGDLVASELSAAGFKVLSNPNQAGPSTIVLVGTVEQLFVEPKLNYFTSSFETDVALKLSARTATGLLAERRFYVKGEEATVFASEQDMQKSLDSGVRQLVTSVVGAVANLADEVPPVPRVPPPGPPAERQEVAP
ncbi:MAG TPA: YajG family lipoprotein [Polyangia bacterium]